MACLREFSLQRAFRNIAPGLGTPSPRRRRRRANVGTRRLRSDGAPIGIRFWFHFVSDGEF